MAPLSQICREAYAPNALVLTAAPLCTAAVEEEAPFFPDAAAAVASAPTEDPAVLIEVQKASDPTFGYISTYKIYKIYKNNKI